VVVVAVRLAGLGRLQEQGPAVHRQVVMVVMVVVVVVLVVG
jgi:hypothetical protein